MSSELELSWNEIFFGETHFYAERDKPDICVLQWHEAGSTLYISIKDSDLVDIRFEREVHDVKYQTCPTSIADNTAVVAFKILPHRPLGWAKGTDLVGGWSDRSQIVIQIVVDDSEAIRKYGRLCRWIKQNTFAGGAEILNKKASEKLWDYANRDFVDVDDADAHVIDVDNVEARVRVRKGNDRIVLDRFNIGLSITDIERIIPPAYANDSLVEYGIRKKAREGCHIMSTFSYNKMIDKGPESINKCMGKRGDIFQHEMIIFPINENNHWYLAIIDQPKNMLVDPNAKSSVDSGPRTTRSTPSVDVIDTSRVDPDTMMSTIYILDSYSSSTHNPKIYDFFKKSLLHATTERLGNPASADIKRIRHFDGKVPRQPNSVDCGYYAIHNAHVFMEQSVKSREIIELCESKADRVHWKEDEAKNKRKWVYDMIRADIASDGLFDSDPDVLKAMDNIKIRLEKVHL